MDPNELVDNLPVAEELPDDDKRVEPPEEPEKKEVEAKEPEKKEEVKPEVKPAPKEKDRVPLATFLEEKNRLQRQLDTERQEREQLKAELEKLKNPPKAAPKYEEDPTGYIKHVTDESAQRVIAKLDESQTTLKEVKETTQQQQARENEQRFYNDLQTREASFVQANPDYYEALDYVRQMRVKQLQALNEVGMADLSEEAIVEQIKQEEMGLALNVMRAGRNPAEVIFKLAGQYGYTKKAPVDAKQEQQQMPELKGQKKLDPDMTLGKSTGNAPDHDDTPDPDSVDQVEVAISELFGKRR